MALFHFHVTQVKRSAGQSIVTSAAYHAGEKLFSEYYGEVSDYTHKGGVVCTDIFLPPHAPAEYQDRATLWNAVEKAERGKKAQLAYSFDIALQNELSLDENIALARQFISDQLVRRGMIADLAIHQPDKEDGGIPNPHFHILCPIRPIEASGKWGCKQRRRYRLDENGNRIIDEDGKPVFDAVPTTDWGDPATLEEWRRVWAEMVNAKFAEKGLECRIDHRAYVRQGLELLPTVHEGPAVREMEAKGIVTDKSELNRWIKSTNALIKSVKKKIASMLVWIGEIKEELSQPKPPTLASLLISYYQDRDKGAWSQKAKTLNLKQLSETVNFLTDNDLLTIEDLEGRVKTIEDKTNTLRTGLKVKSNRMKKLQELLDLAKSYNELKPVVDEMNAIKFKGRRKKFQEAHDSDLRRFQMVRRKLGKYVSSAGIISTTGWKKEMRQLREEYNAEYAEYKPINADLKKLWAIRQHINDAIRQQEQRHHTRSQKQQL